MGTYWGVPLIALAVVLQATIIPQIRILGGQPDLVFLLVLSWSINGRLEQSVVWSFVGGIAQDLLSAAPVGASALGLIFLVFAVDQIKQQVYRVGFLLIVGLVIFGTILQKVVFLIVIAIVGFTIYPVDTFTYVILPTIAYNLIFIWPIYWLIRRIQRRRIQEQHIITS
ncbi:MAG TPA: rod shape-determining protein MreD [Phototrophicaceae bacterium]|nr:rod shape-determining protein MreD [Phototrophicaceae bacterium]